jgi:GINS complex subunit 4
MDSFPDSSPGLLGSAEKDVDGGENEPWIHKSFSDLMRRWNNEKYAPEILPFDLQLVEDHRETLDLVSETLQEDQENAEPADLDDTDYILRCTDYERVLYVLRDYLRIRLWKLSRWPQHYLEPNHMDVLSDAERAFLRDYWDARKGFLQHRLLDALPHSKQGLEDKMDLLDMVRRPNLDAQVYARVTDEIPEIYPSPSMSTQGSESEPLKLVNGQTYLIRYSLIREFLIERSQDGKVELV